MSRVRVEKLALWHAIDKFDCGVETLNNFLKSHALPNQLAHGSQTYVGLVDETVVGFHTLAVGAVAYEFAPERLRKGLARHPVPVMVLARLAIHRDWQGKGAGAGLLRDAVKRTLSASEIAGIRALVVHSKDEAALAFYMHFGFAPGFSDPLTLYLLTKELKRLTEEV